MIWELIIFSALTAWIFRLIPFLARNSHLLSNSKGNFYRFLTYSTQGMLGVIIYNSIYASKNFIEWMHHLNLLVWIKLLLLIVTFIWVAKSQKMLPAFCTGLILYLMILLWIY